MVVLGGGTVSYERGTPVHGGRDSLWEWLLTQVGSTIATWYKVHVMDSKWGNYARGFAYGRPQGSYEKPRPRAGGGGGGEGLQARHPSRIYYLAPPARTPLRKAGRPAPHPPGDTTPCQVTPVILHGVVSPDSTQYPDHPESGLELQGSLEIQNTHRPRTLR